MKLAGGGTADAAVPATLGGQAVTLNNGGFVTSLRGATFDYSERGFLRQITPPIPEVSEFYAYDSSLRRVMRQLGPTDGPAPAPADVDFYVYEGLDRVAVITPRFDGGTGSWTAGDLKEGYLFDGIDHPLRIHLPATNTIAYYELDLAGNVRALRASGGSDLGGYRYTAFGQTVEDTTTISQPLRWKARWFSPLAGGTYHVRARQWSPEMGAFLAADEYSYFESGHTLWAWARQSPARYSDPSGHEIYPPGGFHDPYDPPRLGPHWHRCRNRHNVCPLHPPNMCPSEKDNGWTFGGVGGPKWRSPLGYECAYDDDGNLLPDKNANYTYNYGANKWSPRHIIVDWLAHWLFGMNSSYDPNLTTTTECE